MNGRERDVLIEVAVGVHRDRDREGRVVPPPAWWDLPPGECEELYRRQLLSRELEKAVDSTGRSGTVRAVLARIGGVA